jgi:hypothetical protein
MKCMVAASDAPVRPVAWPEAVRLVKTGDIGLCRPSTLEGRAIVRVTRMCYCHAMMLGWKFGHAGALPRLMIGETVGHRDARLIDAHAEVVRYPGIYDVYRVRPEWWEAGAVASCELAWDFMCQAAGSGYSWTYIWREWVRFRLPKWLQWICPPIANSQWPESPRDCSGLVHAALRFAGGPQVNPFDCEVVPGDLADRRFFEYVCTLFENQQQVENFLFHMERVNEKSSESA